MAMLLAGFALIALIDFIPLVRRHSRRAAGTFLVLFFAGLSLAVLQVCGVEVPSVMLFLGKAIKAVGWSY